jgi:hypothetical protein
MGDERGQRRESKNKRIKRYKRRKIRCRRWGRRRGTRKDIQ